jgi:hypothetical protein
MKRKADIEAKQHEKDVGMRLLKRFSLKGNEKII